MPSDNKPNQSGPECYLMDMLEKLFGPLDLSNEDRYIVYLVLSSAIIQGLAEKLADEYRTKNQQLPDDIQSVLDATQEVSRWAS